MLCDLATLKAWLGITSTTYDTRLTTLIEGVDSQVKSYCHRNFEQGTVVAKLELFRDDEVVLDETPVEAILYSGAGTLGALTITKAGANSSAFFKTAQCGTSYLHLVSGFADTKVAVAVTDTLDDLAANIVAAGWTASVTTGYGDYPAHALLDQATGDSEDGDDIELYAALRPVVMKRTDTEGVYRFRLQDDGWRDPHRDGIHTGPLVVMYTGGYLAADIPAGLTLEVIKICCDAWRSFGVNAAMRSESVGDYSYQKFEAAAIASAIGPHMAALDMWRRA